MRAIRDLPPTRRGDAIRALIAAVLFVVIGALIDVIWPGARQGWANDLLTGALFGLFMFAWFRWLHRGDADAPHDSPPA
jgi:uncharacterized membrane protein